MRALMLLACVPVAMWVAQSALLLASGRPLTWRISGAGIPGAWKQVNRAVTKLLFAAVIVGFPLWRGENPWFYYAALLPLEAAAELVSGVAAAVIYLALLYLAWVATDNLRIEVRHAPGRLAGKFATVPLTAALAAAGEELLFRGVLLADLLRDMPTLPAVVIGSLVFAAAHYVRAVKRYWTFPGHVALGLLFSVAFVATGTLWLPMGLHAGGVLMIMGLRPVGRLVGPAWVCGASIFPYAGAVGMIALLVLTAQTWWLHER